MYPNRLNKFYNFNIYHVYTDLLISQYKNLSEIVITQNVNLNILLDRVLKNNKYYANYFGDKKSITVEDLKQIATLTKKI